MRPFTTETLEKALTEKLMLNFSKTPDEATDQEMMRACALVLRDVMAIRGVETRKKTNREQRKRVHYLSMEFLMGRSLMKNAYNLDVLPQLKEALNNLGFKAGDIFEMEPDAALGNGGLGRLAACYLDSMTTLEIPATGYSICYELGIFKQKIIDGKQQELADNWLGLGDAWLIPKMEEAEEVRFGGKIVDRWENGVNHPEHVGYTAVLAIPRDMKIAGYNTHHTNTLRLWDAKSPLPVDMSLYSRGEYLKAVEQQAMAEVIAKVLYPDDNHAEGKSLRLKQQYFFVSATVQSIVRQHKAQYGTLRNFARKHVIQINDTHPTLVIPELMRILLDQEGYGWDEAWHIVTDAVCYTNHTILSEALERWPQNLIETLLPRIWQILTEIARRYQNELENRYGGDTGKIGHMAIIWGGEVRMANLCVCACQAINGVSALHSEILKRDVFLDAYQAQPGKFKNVTNGIDHRRWLSQVNPKLDALIRDCIGGDSHLLHPEELRGLEKHKDDNTVLQRLEAIKSENKRRFASYLGRESGVILNTDAIFDVQVKRLHEYKRQLLNVLHIVHLYNQLRDNPNMEFTPQTFLFGAKAAPGYYVAKEIIQLINSLSVQIAKDPVCKDKLQVVFLENYRVSLAEMLMPASEVSQQISTAGKEASGTGNMKFMMNGALTVGTLDGANVEMNQVLGDENMFLFGLHADEVEQLKREGYVPQRLYTQDETLRRCVDALRTGFRDGVTYEDLYQRLLFGSGGSAADEYLLLADFGSYCQAEKAMAAAYTDRDRWNRMSLHNIARSGIFAADRSVKEYADNIWHVSHR